MEKDPMASTFQAIVHPRMREERWEWENKFPLKIITLYRKLKKNTILIQRLMLLVPWVRWYVLSPISCNLWKAFLFLILFLLVRFEFFPSRTEHTTRSFFHYPSKRLFISLHCSIERSRAFSFALRVLFSLSFFSLCCFVQHQQFRVHFFL